MPDTVPMIATNDRIRKRHRELIAVGFAIQMIDVENFTRQEEMKVDVYVAQLHICDRTPNDPRPRMPQCLRAWADEEQW